MNKIEKIELEKSVKDLTLRNNEIKGLILAENSLGNAEKLDAEYQENEIKISNAQNKLNENNGEITMTKKYIETKNSIADFMDVLKNSNNKAEVANKWNAKLAENGLEIKDESLVLPTRLVSSIESALTNTNPVFKAFKVTSVGALLVTQGLDSADEAQVHAEGTEKTVKSAVLTVDAISPSMIYKIQTISERAKQLNANFDEIYQTIVAELTQAIVNKAVDLALVEGDGTNGFVSLANEKDAKKVKKITSAKYVDGIEDAVDFTRATAGTKYLIVTAVQRKAILAEVRALNANARVRNSDAEIASEVGVDELIVYTGSKALKPTVLVQDAYHIDMKDLTKVDAFEWKTNENAILLESLSAGKVEKFAAAAVITITGA
ncbi:MAG: hypothetical protein LKF39_06705 [Lactococcus raffinolactis]|jgi:hypothetical protein|nr:hypothetical protein [Lactococcus raffinolactis]